jgi:hypothetical protein
MKGYLFLFVAILLGCQSQPDTLFTQMSPEQTGVTFINQIEETPTLNIFSYEYLYNGGGVAAGDFNNDGLEDLFFTGNQVPNKLYLNKGDWQFEDITAQAQVAGREGWKTGVSVVDINGDDWLDIYVCYSGPGTDQSRANQLFINNGTATSRTGGETASVTFTEQAQAYGLDAPGTYSTQASFFDYDLDGDLDMFLLNHAKITYSPFYNTRKLRNLRHPQFGNRLYRNDGGKFTDVSEQAHIHGSGINFGLGIAVSDLNGDGWPDIYVTNDYEEQDFCYLNQHDGTFTECLKENFRHISRFGMGVDIADYNNDALPDVFVADMLPEDSYRQKLLKGPDEYDKYMLLRDSGYHHQNMRNMLQLNLGNTASQRPQFSEIGQLAGVSNTDWSWSPLFADLDNDGYKDLFVTNGYLRDYTNMDFLKYTFEEHRKKATDSGQPLDTLALIRQMPATRLRNYCFHNQQNLTFSNVAQAWGFTQESISSGAVYADLDNDGDLDLVTSNSNEAPFLYRNNSRQTNAHHFLKIKLQGTRQNTRAIGAKVFVKAAGLEQLQENLPVRGFQSCMPSRLLFGLGAQATAAQILVQWPDRTLSRFSANHLDTMLVLKQGKDALDSTTITPLTPLFEDQSTLTSRLFRHQENDFIDFKVQTLLPYQLSRSGPCLARADVNNDGYDDFYVGGAAGQSGDLFISNASGDNFTRPATRPWAADAACEDTDATFFDADKDGDTDLYVVSGGSEFSHEQSQFLKDRLYLNDGRGNFHKAENALPSESADGSCVAWEDFDKDGDVDLFIGGRSLPGYFPLPAYSYLYRNDSSPGNVAFTDITPDFLRKPGMINTAIWFDYNHDQWKDLVMAGDFTPVLVFDNVRGTLVQSRDTALLPASQGLWSKLVVSDLDNDGDEDLVAGNAGLNLAFKASASQPMTLHYHDFNEDGRIDPVLSYFVQGKPSLYASRDELIDQLPDLKKKFVHYADYARATLPDILAAPQLQKARVLQVQTLASIWIKNNGSKGFQSIPLPMEAQFSRASGIVVDDFTGDGKKDILLAGNFYPYRVQLGRNDAGSGVLLTLMANGSYTCLPMAKTGFYATGDVRSLIPLRLSKGRYVLVGINDDSLKLFKLNSNRKSFFR